MRYHLFYKHATVIGEDAFAACAEIHGALSEVSQHVASDYDFLLLGNGWAVVRARLLHESAKDEVEAAGWIVWPHLVEHFRTLEDHHHVGIVPGEAGVVTGDSPLVAAEKLYKHSGKWRPLGTTIVF